MAAVFEVILVYLCPICPASIELKFRGRTKITLIFLTVALHRDLNHSWYTVGAQQILNDSRMHACKHWVLKAC